MKSIIEYINENVDNEQFTKDMHDLYNMVDGLCGDENVRETIVAYLADLDDIDDDKVHYIYSEKKMFYVLYDIVNYDYIGITKDGKINIKNSNHKDVAKIMKKYCTPKIIKMVYERIFE